MLLSLLFFYARRFSDAGVNGGITRRLPLGSAAAHFPAFDIFSKFSMSTTSLPLGFLPVFFFFGWKGFLR